MKSAQAGMSPKLTIVLTLKDRPEFTRRWMQFMNDQCCPYKILIADGGADKAIEDQLRNSGNYPNLDYEYIRYPFDANFRCFYTKQLDVCGRVKTDYLLWADDDDFYLIEKIPLLIDFLDSNPDYSGCRGKDAHFYLASKDVDVINSHVGGGYRAILSASRSIEDEKFIERAERFFNEVDQYNLWLNWYCIFRTDKVLSSLETIYKYNFSDAILNEILFALLLMREGKIKVTDQLFYLRQSGSPSTAASIHAENNLLEWFLINNVFHNFNNFILQEGVVVKEGDRIRILKAFSNYIGIWCIEYFSQFRKELPIGENIAKICKKIMRRNEKLYGLARKLSCLFRGARERQGTRVTAIESYILKK